MLDGEIDMAVHSMKDMPAVIPEGLTIGCIPEREDFPRRLHQQKSCAPEGYAVRIHYWDKQPSPRSPASFRQTGLENKWIRGNIDTRLSKLESDGYDAIILAAAGLSRMGWTRDVVTEFLDPDLCLPAVGQGALSIECRESDSELLALLEQFACGETTRTVTAERAFLHRWKAGARFRSPFCGRKARRIHRSHRSCSFTRWARRSTRSTLSVMTQRSLVRQWQKV